jgi:hypothetical protein
MDNLDIFPRNEPDEKSNIAHPLNERSFSDGAFIVGTLSLNTESIGNDQYSMSHCDLLMGKRDRIDFGSGHFEL